MTAKAVISLLLLVLLLVASTKSSLLSCNVRCQLTLYRLRVQMIHNVIKEECPDQYRQLNLHKREENDDNTSLRIEKKLYRSLIEILGDCEATQAQCMSAINLTESWRRDNNGSDMKPLNGGTVYNCDTKQMVADGRPWFRFTGEAGQRILNTCPPAYSCGTKGSLWTNQPLPNDVGVTSTVQVYASHASNCKYKTFNASVMRCSSDSPHDLVYRYDGTMSGCYYGFCGMN